MHLGASDRAWCCSITQLRAVTVQDRCVPLQARAVRVLFAGSGASGTHPVEVEVGLWNRRIPARAGQASGQGEATSGACRSTRPSLKLASWSQPVRKSVAMEVVRQVPKWSTHGLKIVRVPSASLHARAPGVSSSRRAGRMRANTLTFSMRIEREQKGAHSNTS